MLIMDSRSAGNPLAMWEREIIIYYHIRPSTQGSWEYPKNHFCGATVSSITGSKSFSYEIAFATCQGNSTLKSN
jgi:hypothetical protein